MLTIAGERLELTRFLPARRTAAPSFIAVSALILAGAVLAPIHEDFGHGLFAAGVLAMAAWLLAFDIARHNARQQGLTRFIAICLLSGYVWLALGALAALGGGLAPASPAARHHHARDRARLRILDGVRPRRDHLPRCAEGEDPLPPRLYVPLALLHASLTLRVAGSLLELPALRSWGGIANALALAVFIATMVASVIRGGRPPARRRRTGGGVRL